jgi:hypothetical protein
MTRSTRLNSVLEKQLPECAVHPLAIRVLSAKSVRPKSCRTETLMYIALSENVGVVAPARVFSEITPCGCPF